jgi:PAS domain S-box-containing protein
MYFIRSYVVQLGYCCLLLLSVWLSIFAMLDHDYEHAVATIEQINDQLTRGFEEHVRRSLHAVDEGMLLIKAEYERDRVTPAISAYFNRTQQNPLLLQVLIIDASGKLIASVTQDGPERNFANQAYFRNHVSSDSQQVFISEPGIGRLTGRPFIMMSRRLNAPDGSFAGVVATAVDSAYFSRFYQDVGLRTGQFVRVIGLDGIVRANWPVNTYEIGMEMKPSDLFNKHLLARPNGHYYTSGRIGVPRYISYRTMTDYPLIVQTGFEVEPALSEYYKRRDFYVSAASVASILIVLFPVFEIFNVRRRRRYDERWKLVVEGVNDGIWDWDANTGKVFLSDRYKAILGYKPEEIGDSREEWLSRLHPEDYERVSRAVEDYKEGSAAYYNEIQRLRCKDGSYKWIRSRGRVLRDDSGRAVRMIGAITDIHTEKSAADALRISEQELRDSREKYKALIDQSFEAIILADTKSRQILECNARFSEWFGYILPDDAPLYIDQYLTDEAIKQENYFQTLLTTGYVSVERRTFRHKNGSLIFMERAASLIKLQDQQFSMITYRNISDQMEREQAMRQDVAIAQRIQRALLSKPTSSEFVGIETVFRPCGDISGDLYHLEWCNEGQVLRGYLIEVPGYGLTTALYTAALNVMLHEVAELDAPLTEQLRWLNQQITQNFGEVTRVAAIGFEIDLQTRELRYAGAGIVRFWANTAAQTGSVDVAGYDLSIDHNQAYSLQTMPLKIGDLLYFTTNFMSDSIGQQIGVPLDRFREMISLFVSLQDDPGFHDDVTAVCIRINSLPQMVDASKWPKVLKMNGYGDYQRLKSEVATILADTTGQSHSLQEVAVNEAIANALECRDGQARNQKARIKFNRVGSRLIVRVKTSRIGFAGNAILRRLRSQPEDMFSFGEDAAMGRGIPMMLSMSHKMTYNSEGTEVLLAWRL